MEWLPLLLVQQLNKENREIFQHMALQGKVRIIGGQWRSRLITFPDLADLRPTPDRIRETLFNWLGQDLSGLNCLDLFAGSGALGFEAASRGAEQVVMVESDARAFKALQENKAKLQAAQIQLIRVNALEFIASDLQHFDIVFLDPPYRLELLPELLPLMSTHLKKTAQVYIETRATWIPDTQWHVRRSGRAGAICYQLIEPGIYG
jgi:16S rRNA (guanine966-N2)-methyltransferase